MSQQKQFNFELRHSIYSFIPTIKIFKDAQLIGFIRIKFFANYRKITHIYSDRSMLNPYLTLENIGSHYKNVQFEIKNINNPTHNFILKHIGARTIYKRNNWELSRNAIIFAKIRENSGNISMFRHFILLIPIIGEFLEQLFSLTPRTYEISSIDNLELSDSAGTIKVYKNILGVNTKLDLNDAQVKLNLDEYIGLLSVIELLEVSKVRY